jgi:hypothetical protein
MQIPQHLANGIDEWLSNTVGILQSRREIDDETKDTLVQKITQLQNEKILYELTAKEYNDLIQEWSELLSQLRNYPPPHIPPTN